MVLSAIYDEEKGELIGFSNITRDTTRQKLAQDKLEASFNRADLIRRIMEIINQSFAINDILGQIVRELAEFFQVDRCLLFDFEQENTDRIQFYQQYCRTEEIQPVPVTEIPLRTTILGDRKVSPPNCGIILKLDSPEDFPDFYKPFARKYNIQAVVGLDICYRQALYGRLVIHQCNGPRTWQPDELSLLEDISTHLGVALYQARLFYETQQAKEVAELASKRKSQALANMSHELRTPLNAVIGYSEMMLKGFSDTPEKREKYARNIATSGRHLLDIINQILDISKLEAGKIELYPEHFEVAQVVDEVIEILQPMAEAKGVTITRDYQPFLNSIYADRSRFKQILFNLLSNAIKFNTQGGTVQVRFSKTEDRQWLIGQVCDTGIGIPKDKLENLFTEFYQVGGSTKTREEGTGLGLSLTKRLLEVQGGNIVAKSGHGKTIFTFMMPVRTLRRQMPKRPDPTTMTPSGIVY